MRLLTGEPAAGPWRTVTLDEVVARLLSAAGPVTGRPVVVAIDGRSSSGKTSLSERLAQAVSGGFAVHSDDIAWNHAAFQWSDAMVEGVLAPIHRGEAVDYRPPGWVTHGRSGSVVVPAGLSLLVVEGDGSSRRSLAQWYDAVVFVQSDQGVVEARNDVRVAAGEMSPADFASWMAEEDPFVLADQPWERAELVVTGTPMLALPDAQEPGPDEVVACWEPPARSLHLLETTYAAITSTVESADPASPTGTEWAVGELLFHLLLDAQRALLTLASPVDTEPDVDAASYWAPFVPGASPDEEADHLRWVRAAAAAYPSARELRRHWEVTSAAALRAVRKGWYADPGARVTTQGHVLTVDDFASTLLVEATVHQLDLTAYAAGPPVPAGALAHVRGVLERILGGPLPETWSDVDAARKATGRAPLTDDDRAALGDDAERLPLLG